MELEMWWWQNYAVYPKQLQFDYKELYYYQKVPDYAMKELKETMNIWPR